MFITNDPGSWQQYVKRKDNIGLSIDTVKRKYLTESIRYNEEQFRNQQFINSLTAVSAGSGGGATSSGPVGGSGTIVFNGLDVSSGGSYVAAPNAGLSWLPGTGNFTIEWFQYQTVGGGHPRVFSVGPDTTAKYGVSIEANNVYTWPNGNNFAIGKTYVNKWIHVALVRSAGSTSCYIDGTQVGTSQSDTTDITAGSYSLYIGSDGLSTGDTFTGNITNFRWTNSVVYTGASFTPITSPLTVLPQTKLLLLGGSAANPVVDATGINTLNYANTTWSAATPFA